MNKWTALLGQFDYGNDGSRRVMSGDPDSDDYRRVCSVDPVAPRKDRGNNKTPYNAPDVERDKFTRLIAAAPELLEALELARNTLYEHGDARYTAPVIERIEVAIAKARGEK